MSQRVSVRSSRTSTLRTRVAAVAAALGASVVLGAGVASAAEPAAAQTAQTSATAKAAKEAKTAKSAKSAKSAKAKKAKKAVSWAKPVKKYTKSASFAQNGGMWQSTHSGQDFAVASGTQVYAAHGGTVVKAGGNGAGDGPAYGNAVVIKHGNGTYSQYAHLSKIQVKAGQIVKTGQRIALSGNTGNSSGPHLHFEIRTTANYGTAVDPVAFLRAKGLSL